MGGSTCSKCLHTVGGAFHVAGKTCFVCKKPFHRTCLHFVRRVSVRDCMIVPKMAKADIYEIKSIFEDSKGKSFERVSFDYVCETCYSAKYRDNYVEWKIGYDSHKRKERRRKDGYSGKKPESKGKGISLPCPLVCPSPCGTGCPTPFVVTSEAVEILFPPAAQEVECHHEKKNTPPDVLVDLPASSATPPPTPPLPPVPSYPPPEESKGKSATPPEMEMLPRAVREGYREAYSAMSMVAPRHSPKHFSGRSSPPRCGKGIKGLSMEAFRR